VPRGRAERLGVLLTATTADRVRPVIHGRN
jgi:hypothetical protein